MLQIDSGTKVAKKVNNSPVLKVYHKNMCILHLGLYLIVSFSCCTSYVVHALKTRRGLDSLNGPVNDLLTYMITVMLCC